MIKNKLLLVALIATSILIPAGAIRAQSFSIEIGDRPYYSHGSRYWAGDWEMVWVPGHWSNHRGQWVHGHYVRGEHRRHHDMDRHHDDRHDQRDDRRDDRHDDRRDDRHDDRQ